MKYRISTFFRKLGLIKHIDKIHFYVCWIKSHKHRKRFKKKHPYIKLPPAYFIYETFKLDYFGFYNHSIESAKDLIKHFEKYKKLEGVSVLDWGCGPGRIIRHLPSFMDKTCKFYGSDYNEKYIKWCKKNIPNVSFETNELTPPLNFERNSFDIIYGISIFTHLSREMHYAWFDELFRVLKPGGIILLSLQGNAFIKKLTESEKNKYKKGDLVVKANTKEGHRTYSAFQPKSFVKELVGENEILEHKEGYVSNDRPQQDIWIIKKCY